VQTWRYGGSDVWRQCRYLYEFASRALEVWRCAASVGTSRYGGLEMRYGRVDAGDLEACCGCRDVLEFASRVLEMRCRRVDARDLGACCGCRDV